MIWLIIASIAIFIFGFVPWAIGVYTMFHWSQKPPEGNDDSNRINNIISWHIGLTRPDVLGKYWKLFQMDVMDIIRAVGQRNEK